MYYSSKRQGFLIDQVSDASTARSSSDVQGYAFKVITELHGIEEMEDLVFRSQADQIGLLEQVINAGDNAAETSDHYMKLNHGHHQRRQPGAQSNLHAPAGSMPAVQRFTAPLEHLSGGQNMSYNEQKKSLK